jgi:hypothetical protein
VRRVKAGRARAETKSFGDVAAEHLRGRFVGRRVELARLERLLGEVGAEPRVVVVTGVAGVGKTTLLRRFAGAARGIAEVLWISGEEAVATEDGLVDGLARARPGAAFASLGRGARADVVVLDGFDHLDRIEAWLFDRALPTAGRKLLVVVGSRLRLGPRVRVRPDLAPLLDEIHLANFDDVETSDQLARAGIPAEHHARLHAWTMGHPLTLALVAERYDRGALPTSIGEVPDVVSTLVHELLREAPSPGHVDALHALAVAGVLDEALLGAALPSAPVASLFRWLSQRSFVDAGRRGLCAHLLVRAALLDELRRTNPEKHTTMAARLAGILVGRIRSASDESSRLRVYQQALFAGAPFPAEWSDPSWLERVELRRARLADLPIVAAMIERFEGAAARRVFDLAAAEQLDRLLIVTDGEPEPAGVLFPLTLRSTSAQLRAADPVLAASHAWLLDQEGDSGRDAIVFRWFMSRHHHAFGREMFCVMTVGIIATPFVTSPRYVLIPLENAEQWRHLDARFMMRPEPAADAWFDGRLYGASVCDLGFLGPRSDTDEAMLDLIGAVVASASGRGVAVRITPGPPAPLVDRAAFEAAWRAALPSLHRPIDLRGAPIHETAIARRAADARGPEAAPLAAIERVVARLRESHGHRRSAELLRVVYVEGAEKHQAAAASMRMPYGTFRYQLRKATQLLIEELWRDELEARA